MSAITAKRKEAEKLIYNVFNKLDPSGANANYYKQKFEKMSDAQFISYIKQQFPYKFQTRLFKIEPNMDRINEAAKTLGIPLMEKVYCPYFYKDSKGNDIATPEAIVGYVPIKKMKQFITKKNAMSVNIDMRDNKTGLLISKDKNGITSDRELECLAVMGLDQSLREFSRPRADAMTSKSVMYNTINTLGKVDLKDLPDDPDDSLAKNMLNVYLLGAGLDSNLLNKDGYLPITYKNKHRATERE